LIFNGNRYGPENAINNKKIQGADPEAFEKTPERIEDAGSENEDIHEDDIGNDYIEEDQGFLVAIPLDRHGAKVGNCVTRPGPIRLKCQFKG
jgi:hypothetical protein